MKYALDCIEDPHLDRPAHIILISPMIGVTRFARFAGLAALPALLPPFEKASWLGVVPEFNPFKYNSFPVNGARQSHRLTSALQEQLARLARARKLDPLPPVLTFQSVIDFTVSTHAIVTALREPASQRKRTGPVRCEPAHKTGAVDRSGVVAGAGQVNAGAAFELQAHHGGQRNPMALMK